MTLRHGFGPPVSGLHTAAATGSRLA